MFMDPSEDFLLFEEGFFLEWGHCLLMGTNCFTDPRGNVLNIEFEENLMAERKFRASDDIVNFYDVYDIEFVCTLYCGDRYFRFRVFDIDWNEIEYPLIYFADEVEMIYEGESVGGLNNDSGGIVNNVGAVNPHDFLNSHDGLVKKLTKYDVQTSSLYLHLDFARQFLEKGRRRYFITISTSKFSPCKIRWTRRSSFECYMTCGWKRFCKDNQLAAGDELKFDFLLFEEGFFLEWGHCLLMGTNCFTDPRGNVLNIEFEENLMAERKFRASDDIVNFYDVYDIEFVCTLYCGDRYFRVKLELSKIYFADEVEMIYEGESVGGLNNDSGGIVNNVGAVNPHDFLNSHDGLVKKLTKYDVQTSSLYLHLDFARQFLEKGRRRYFITISTSKFSPCKIRWTRRSSFECYMTCGWKRFCKDNQLAAGDELKFDFLLFEEGFFLEWGHCLLMGTNCFTDPRGNVLNIEFEENLMAERKFRASDDIVNFYDVYDIEFVCTLYCGDRYFRVKLELSKIYFADEVEMIYEGESVGGLNNDSGGIVNNVGAVNPHDFLNSHDGLVKKLTKYDVQTSSLYLHLDFARQFLEKGRRRYFITISTSKFSPCKIRWTRRSSFECYMTCGWKRFCKDNQLAAGDELKFVIDNQQKNVIHVLKV
ncbi:hypothetical protein DEO72_LG3g796 [Vigna unguiculata]|uniref:TF-B3 domain-containing protein n=1 Tax=Vigna unguiculata TaxID=3917 RepID=A0A4D6LD58_VIGUN|nr:hypothetical protein DEO72_LG3g796 [Vigna unguiculata]